MQTTSKQGAAVVEGANAQVFVTDQGAVDAAMNFAGHTVDMLSDALKKLMESIEAGGRGGAENVLVKYRVPVAIGAAALLLLVWKGKR